MSKSLTPLMKQYFDIKKEYDNSLLFFQVGDFYELFFEDAKEASKFLGLALTKRGNLNGDPIPLCGVPVHTLDHYLSKLIKGGFQVVVCDQLEEAVPGKVVKRGVTQVLTPGTLTDTKLLNEKSASYILFFVPGAQNYHLAFVELLTGHIFYTRIDFNDFSSDLKLLEAELFRFFPDEIVIVDTAFKKYSTYFKKLGFIVNLFDSLSIFDRSNGWLNDKIKNLKTNSEFLELYNLMYSYFKKNQPDALEFIQDFYSYRSDDFLVLDSATQKNLEIVSNNQDGSYKNSLFCLMDRAATSMGSRMIKKWLLRPLVKIDSIKQRLDTVQLFIDKISLKEELFDLLKEVSDLERIVGRIALLKAQVHDYIHLKNALKVIPNIKSKLFEYQHINFIKLVFKKLGDFERLHDLLELSLNDDLSRDLIIKDNFDNRLDNIRELVNQSHRKILELEKKEQRETGISSLKIRFNQVFGYYIEITKPNLHLVSEGYKRVQTLSNRERFTTSELKILESDIEKARREILTVEKELFDRIKYEVFSYVTGLKKASYALAHLDALISFSQVAYESGYTRPTFSSDRKIIVENGRHPVVEKKLESSNTFIPNSVNLNDENSLLIITGPNMGGKSTYLRQVALISLMAQCGSFVPAERARLFIVDRIFTRIGAGDNLAEGKSTFLVEMEETATICKQATKNSLVILDEVGRGTSTYDGLALAQAVVEFIYNKKSCFCLFATHYHELTNLEKKFSGISCYYAASEKSEHGIIFLHKIVKGVADGSFGIEVAKLATLPDEIILRAEEILNNFQNSCNLNQKINLKSATNFQPATTLSKSNNRNLEKIYEIFSKLNLEDLSPKASFDLIWKMKEIFSEKK